MKIFYVGLEAREERYSFQLEEWNRRVFIAQGHLFNVVRGNPVPSEIVTGSVLDAHGRSEYSLTQMAELVRMIKAGTITNQDVLFFEDMFTPGLEVLPYIFDQLGWYPKIYIRCLAQTIDPDDFVHRTGMVKWMRHFERLADELALRSGGGILAASEEMVPFLKVAQFEAPIYVTGLPFGKAEVQERASPLPWGRRSRSVCYAARWDSEKQPLFFLEVAQQVYEADRSITFKILTGAKTLRSDDPSLLTALRASDANVQVLEGLSKNDYYGHLATSRVLFNCALQDWVSNTVSEADALGCMTIYPAYRSFPEVFASNEEHMYVPWSSTQAAQMILDNINATLTPLSVGKVSDYQDKTISRTLEILTGHGQAYRRDRSDYRKHVSINKF